jgi:hypothetical protein
MDVQSIADEDTVRLEKHRTFHNAPSLTVSSPRSQKLTMGSATYLSDLFSVKLTDPFKEIKLPVSA